jgi:short subunit dehydrogenase-like uncharacterized protein
MQWQPAPRGLAGGTFAFPPPIGPQRMVRYPSGEQITVPRHVPTRNVRTMLTAATVAPHPRLGTLVTLLGRPTGLALRTPLKRAMEAVLSRLPEGPSDEQRRAARYTIVCDARRGARVRRGVLHGTDAYGITAALVARGALLTTTRGFKGRGALAPSQAFAPRKFLADLDRFEVRWEVEREARDRVPP